MKSAAQHSAPEGAYGKLIVMKFGGSSLGSTDLRAQAVERVRDALAQKKKVIVVTSAIGRPPEPYSTDALLALAPRAPSGPNRDLLLATGEIISAAVFAELLEALGIPARALTGAQAGIMTDAAHGDAHILSIDTGVLRALLDTDVVPVVCGFQGASEDGAITTLGRGGSDLSAVALAGAFERAELDIFTDVDGVMTAEPKRVPDARTIPALTFEEVTELSQHGATVMHDKAAELARLAKIPFAIRSMRSGKGTVISETALRSAEHPVTGVTTAFGYTFLHVVPEAAGLPGGWEQDAFHALSQARISIDCVNVNAAGLFFIVKDADLQSARDKLEPLPLAVRIRRECAKISIVGAGMRNTPGVIYRAVRALSLAGVPIIHSTDSNITISLLVPGSLAANAENALHEQFELARPIGGQ